MFGTTLGRQIVAEFAKRRPVFAEEQKSVASTMAAKLRAIYHPKQAAFFTSKAKLKATKKTRRAGATTGGCRELLARAIEYPGFRGTYVASTKKEARDRAWLSDTKSGLLDILREFGAHVDHPSLEAFTLGGVIVNVYDQAMYLELSNGSKIDIFGFDDERAMRKQRGLAKHVYWIDEAQDIRFLDTFYNAVIMAALSDYKGELWLTGTPGRDCAGMFYDVTKEADDGPPPEAWEVHTISVVDNPRFGRVTGTSENGWLVYYVEDAEGGEKLGPFASYVEADKAAENARWERTAGDALKKKGWNGTEPDFIREWLGRWCREDARFVYPVHACRPHELLYAPQRLRKNPFKGTHPRFDDHPDWLDVKRAITDLPKQKKNYNRARQWMYAISADFGFSPDPFAITVWAFAYDSQDVYELFSWKCTKVHTDDQGAYLKLLWEALDNVVVLVGDPAGKQDDFEVWRTRLQLPIDEANKRGKDTLEEFLADDIRRGRVHLRADSPLHDEMRHLVYLPIKPGKKREVAKYRRAGDGKIHGDHCCLVAGTTVRTARGDVAIEDVQIGESVLTRKGWRRATRAWMTGVKPLYRVTFDDGRYIDGTADHPFWTETGWKQLADLTPQDTFTTCDSKPYTTTDEPTAAIQSTPTERCASISAQPSKPADAVSSSTCTAPCTATTSDQYPTITTCTTATKTRSTTIPPISSSCSAPSISACTLSNPSASRNRASTSSALDSRPRSGIEAPKAERGIASTLSERWPDETSSRSFVSTASPASRARTVTPSSAEVHAEPRLDALAVLTSSIESVRFAPLSSVSIGTASKSAAHIRVLRVEALHRDAEVFNITVDGEHEFFANGVLVSNCDAARYGYEALSHFLSVELPDKPDPNSKAALEAEAEIIEQRIEKKDAARAELERLADADEEYGDLYGY